MKQIIDALEAARGALLAWQNCFGNSARTDNALAEIDAALAAAREQQLAACITVSGPTGCGKSAVAEIIYRALRDAGLHPYSNDMAQERRAVDDQPAPSTKVWHIREVNCPATYAAQQQSQEPVGFTQRDTRGLIQAAPPVPSDEQQPVAWQLLEDLNLASLERVAAEKEAQGEERIPCFLSVEWVKRAVAAWRAAPPAPDAEDAARLAEIREIYAGMEGFVPQTAAEGYCLEIIRKMAHAAMGVQSMADPIQRLHAAVSAYAADDEGLTPLAWNQVRADIAAALRAKDAETARATEGYRIMRAEYDNLERKYDAAEQRAERLAGALRPFAEIALTLDGVPVDFARMVLRARAALDAEESPEPKHQTPENTAGHDIDAEASCLNT